MLRKRPGTAQGELATLGGVSASAVGSWEYGKAKPEGRNRKALVALRKLGRREVQDILVQKVGSRREVAQRPKRAR